MRKLLLIQWIVSIGLLLLCYTPAQAGEDPPVIKVLDGSLGQLKVDSLVSVKDAKVGVYPLVTPYRTESIVSLEVNEGLPIYLQDSFRLPWDWPSPIRILVAT
ncbi:hypothetical protein [Paraflavitalea speifideaquila]|uniref:hypothetical protein n=1 Tax=Paraflavitalea speifideaquila TaxID=3076558 RepID=UPI0028E507D2|nr:hypothetical protein [Paraflavitalea speifideiaquila]